MKERIFYFIILLFAIGICLIWNDRNSASGIYVFHKGHDCRDTLFLMGSGKFQRSIHNLRYNRIFYSEGIWWYSDQHIWLENWDEGCFDIRHFNQESGSWGFAVGRDFFWRIDKIRIDPDHPQWYAKIN